ncbi:MAG: hypothetical protein COA78_10240 [Blastopirellula sp.]|nr:MAG: hypothetical protein COA78_10240 [Blastopirellula sp.]
MKKLIALTTCFGIIVALGCSQETPVTTTTPTIPTVSAIDSSLYLLTAEPEGALTVIATREADNDGEDILIEGRIGGSGNPWLEGSVAFTIVDETLQACCDIPGDNCPKPWDYCCETDKLPTAMALVKLVDENGELLKGDAKEVLNVKELSTVIIKGKAKRDDDGNLIVLASGVYVKK